MQKQETVEFLLRDLPDPQGARLALERIEKDSPRHYQQLIKQPALLADVVALAAWSPLLSTTLEQNPEYLSWLARERTNPRLRTRDELKESLARFALTNSSLNPQVLLARFRRREPSTTSDASHTLVDTTLFSLLSRVSQKPVARPRPDSTDGTRSLTGAEEAVLNEVLKNVTSRLTGDCLAWVKGNSKLDPLTVFDELVRGGAFRYQPKRTVAEGFKSVHDSYKANIREKCFEDEFK